MNYNENDFNSMTGNKRLTRRPLQTPGLDVNTNQNQYNNYGQVMYSQPDNQSIPYKQQFYYQDFTSGHPEQEYGNNDFRFNSPPPINNPINQQQYIPGHQQNKPSMFIPTNNLVDTLGSNQLLAGATVQYGQKILGQVVDENVNKYTNGISLKIKRYFAVDTRYVIIKIGILLFPFAHTNWLVTSESTGNQSTEGRKQAISRLNINAPDLYIPTVSFITYLLLLGLILAKHGQFSPEILSVQASRILALEIIIIIVEVLALYVTNIQSSLFVLDLIAYSGYKYLGIVSCVPFGLIFGKAAFYIILLYTGIAYIYFLLHSIRLKLYSTASMNGSESVMIEYKKKRTLYFLILTVAIQPILTWNLISYLTFTME